MLENLDEKYLYVPLSNIFTSIGHETRIVHGSHEKGKDLIATKPNKYNLLVSVKKGDIDKKRWDNEILSSVEQMKKRPIDYAGVDEELKKRMLLVLTGHLTPAVAALVEEINLWSKEHDEPVLEIWDLEKITNEFHDNLLNINLIGNDDYYNLIQSIILQISPASIPKKLMIDFIDKIYAVPFNFSSRYNVIKIIMIFILKKSKIVDNIYAFFFFAEYYIIKIWHNMFEKDDFSETDLIDEIHEIYFNELINWIETINIEENGLINAEETNYLTELFSYSLRSFDCIRRIAYVCYVSILQSDTNTARKFADKIIKILDHNKSVNFPLCEFNYNDIGLALYVLTELNYKMEARDWLFQLMQSVILNFNLGYEQLPLDKPLANVAEALNFTLPYEKRDINSHIIGLLLEFVLILDGKEIFDTFRVTFPLRVKIVQLITTEESYIYIPDFIHATTLYLNPNEITYEFFKKEHKKRLHILYKSEVEFSMVTKNRPNILILISNHFRDRYFSIPWRKLI
jgi:hypothetical protein